jgi:hypothetical protein
VKIVSRDLSRCIQLDVADVADVADVTIVMFASGDVDERSGDTRASAQRVVVPEE